MHIISRLSLVLSFPAALFIDGEARAQLPTTFRVSVAASGIQGNAHSSAPSISADGRVIAFASAASNLVPNDTNGVDDIFVRDRMSGTIELISLATNNSHGNDHSYAASITPDGRWVAFCSYASNLVAGDTNASMDVFLRDRVGGTTEIVSVASNGALGNGQSMMPAISADGRFVAFESVASNLVAGDTNGASDVFVRDLQYGVTKLVSIGLAGLPAWEDSREASLSADGRFVLFTSAASNLVAGDTNMQTDAFVRDRTNNTTQRVSVATGMIQANSYSRAGSISPDGRFVVFDSVASNLPGSTPLSASNVYLHDRQFGATECVGVPTAQPGGISRSPTLSDDGRFVAFVSSASNLVVGDTNGTWDVFVYDRSSATTARATVDSNGVQANATSVCEPVMSADGTCVAFESAASNLVAADTNGVRDVFVRDLLSLPLVYCTSSTSSGGCTASIAANATPSLSLAHACNITVTNVEGLKSGLLFYGVNNTSFTPGSWAPGSTSVLCVKHPTQRTLLQNSGGAFGVCNGSYVLDWNAYQTAHPLSLGNPWSVGDKVYVQAWFRDPLAVKSTNLSDAVEMTYVP